MIFYWLGIGLGMFFDDLGQKVDKITYIFFQNLHFWTLDGIFEINHTSPIGWFKNPVSSQTEKLMAGTKFSDYLGPKHYKKANKMRHSNHLKF